MMSHAIKLYFGGNHHFQTRFGILEVMVPTNCALYAKEAEQAPLAE
jgi:hypothetical protein